LLILALDTSAAAGSVAVARDGAILIEREGDGSRAHGERLPRELMAALREAGVGLHDVDRFAVATGPGSFTGLRVGIATIQGLALARKRLVAPVTTFEALAWHVRDGANRVGVWIDAHRGEVFAALMEADGRLVAPASSLTPDATLDAWTAAIATASGVRFVGDGAVRYRDVIDRRMGSRAAIEDRVPPLARAIASIAGREPDRAVRPHALSPLYVRRPDAELARDRRRTPARS
jgi:tRNA threonylcarbamoyladenosine biosynthesis protein TsaB